MDYEKAFKEAYGRASLRFGTNVANELFLEYKESKEERTRRKLIEFFSDWSKTKSYCWGIRVTDIMDWLEKQGTSYTKRDVDDAYVEGMAFAKDELEKQGDKQQKTSMWKHWKDGIAGNGEGKQIFLIKVGNTYSLTSCLGFECDYIELSELDNLMLEKQGSAWSEDYTERMGQIINYLTCQAKEEPTRKRTLLGWVALLKSIFRKGLPEIQIPCTEAARKGIHRIMDILEWAADKGRISDSDCEDYMILLSAYLPQPKPAWSEEDEERFQSCLNILQVQTKCFMGITETINTKWLRSLKQRYTWKPSKEQMDAMQMAVSYFDYSWVSKEQKLLESLYKDLKKLTEG